MVLRYINQVSTSKSLGVLIDANITWDSHIEMLAKNIASGIAAIKRVRKFVPPATLHLVYKALIQCNRISTIAMFLGGNCGIKLGDKEITQTRRREPWERGWRLPYFTFPKKRSGD